MKSAASCCGLPLCPQCTLDFLDLPQCFSCGHPAARVTSVTQPSLVSLKAHQKELVEATKHYELLKEKFSALAGYVDKTTLSLAVEQEMILKPFQHYIHGLRQIVQNLSTSQISIELKPLDYPAFPLEAIKWVNGCTEVFNKSAIVLTRTFRGKHDISSLQTRSKTKPTKWHGWRQLTIIGEDDMTTDTGLFPYTNGKLDGVVTYWRCQYKRREESWVMNQRHGWAYSYHLNGQVAKETYWVKGQRQGWQRNYADNGQLIARIHWLNDKMHGRTELYRGSWLHSRTQYFHGETRECEWHSEGDTLSHTMTTKLSGSMWITEKETVDNTRRINVVTRYPYHNQMFWAIESVSRSEYYSDHTKPGTVVSEASTTNKWLKADITLGETVIRFNAFTHGGVEYVSYHRKDGVIRVKTLVNGEVVEHLEAYDTIIHPSIAGHHQQDVFSNFEFDRVIELRTNELLV